MVHCRKLKDNKCSFTGGRCILTNPNTKEQYKLCTGAVLAKDYSEMTRAEKAFVNSIENNKRIAALEARITKLEMKTLVDGISHGTRKIIAKTLRNKMPPPDKEGVAEILKLMGNEKKGGLINWLRHLGK